MTTHVPLSPAIDGNRLSTKRPSIETAIRYFRADGSGTVVPEQTESLRRGKRLTSENLVLWIRRVR
jgi:hypothetical protein